MTPTSRRAAAALAASFLATALPAAPVEQSLRPQLRPAAETGSEGAYTLAATQVTPQAAPRSTRAARTDRTVETAPPGFARWVAAFRPRALEAGIAPQVFDAAFKSARYDAEVIERDRNQSEFTTAIWDYLDRAASDSRIENGRAALAEHGATLQRIEDRYGVDREVVTAVWGMESAYGAHRGTKPIIGSLATLAYEGRRAAFFETQLIAALKILQNGDTTPEKMTGSWAGAMGHTQFIPTSYEALAVDFTGDGRRDIWADDPTDALASTAAYLAHHGWVKGMPWGVEVRLPESFDFSQADRAVKKMPSDWADAGVLGVDGRPVRDWGSASVLLPAGAEGAAFLVFKNFDVIARYNAATAYVMGVGHLADRISGGGPIAGDWPRDDRALSYKERTELQRRLTAAGYDTQGVDGRIGPRTEAAIRAFQRRTGMAPDGYASLRVLSKLR